MTSRRLVLTSGLAALATPASAASKRGRTAAAPVARTTSGPVRGYLDGGIKVFKGVRYGAAPRRFEPPAPPATWTEPADATGYGPASFQRDEIGRAHV